jgi:hypothetical protein
MTYWKYIGRFQEGNWKGYLGELHFTGECQWPWIGHTSILAAGLPTVILVKDLQKENFENLGRKNLDSYWYLLIPS